MTGIELVSLIASIASLILAVGAIWLSIAFFKMSNEASKATTEAAKGIDASIKRLENLFDKLYSDTFTMMKDTVSDMRKHIWNGDQEVDTSKNDILEEAERKAEEKTAVIKSALEKQLNQILERQKAADGKVSDIGKELESLLDNAIETSRLVDSEAREETIRSHIMTQIKVLQKTKSSVIADDIVQPLSETLDGRKVVLEIERMRDDNLLSFDGENLDADSRIKLTGIKGRMSQNS
jgi:hypothetical protein